MYKLCLSHGTKALQASHLNTCLSLITVTQCCERVKVQLANVNDAYRQLSLANGENLMGRINGTYLLDSRMVQDHVRYVSVNGGIAIALCADGRWWFQPASWYNIHGAR